MTTYTLVSALTGDRVPGGTEISDPACPVGLDALPQDAIDWMQEGGWGDDDAELVYVLPGEVPAPAGFETFTFTTHQRGTVQDVDIKDYREAARTAAQPGRRRLAEIARLLEPAAHECAARPEWAEWTPVERLHRFFSDPDAVDSAYSLRLGMVMDEVSRLASMAPLAEVLADHRTPEGAIPVLLEYWADRVPEGLATIFGYVRAFRP